MTQENTNPRIVVLDRFDVLEVSARSKAMSSRAR